MTHALPRLRGRIHQLAFGAALVALWFLVTNATGPARLAAWVYGLSSVLLYAASATHHRISVHFELNRYLQRLDHTMIYVLIAGTYTPVCLLAVSRPAGLWLLATVWAAAAIGAVIKLAGLHRLDVFAQSLYLVIGWAALVAVPFLDDKSLLWPMAAGGVLYTIGAVLFALNWPRRPARWFGYHELWHVLGVLAAVVFFAVNYTLVTAA